MNEQLNTILICIPTYETVCPETFKAVYDLDVPEGFERPDFQFVKGYGCDIARNKCAKLAIEGNYTYLMFIDSDVVVPKKCLCHMTEYDCDICMGAYPRNNSATRQTEVFLDTAYNFYDENNVTLPMLEKFRSVSSRVNVKGGGMGCTLIKTSLFEKLSYPYFRYVQYDDGDTLSEDNYFCWQAKKRADALIQLDTRISCKHKSTGWLES